jgi:ATP-dependent helicase/nuclease subunit B
MADSAPRLYTIPASVPFLPALADALLDGRLVPGYASRHDPLTLADATVYLPNRRAARAFGFALLDALGQNATLLPRILPLGDIDEEALAFSEEVDAEELPPAIDPLRRRLVLAKLVLQWTRQLASATGSADPLIATTPAAAIALADQLAHLFDDITLANIPFERIGKAVPPNLDQYWEISRQFLEIAHQGWSAYLQEQNLLDPAVRRDKLLVRETERLAKNNTGPVIAAGSTGSLPAVANMLRVIAQHKSGAVVLPGLDQNLDDESFDAIDGVKSGDGSEVEGSPGHPQFGLKRLLTRIGAKRADVVPLAKAESPHREKILSEAFRPAATTDRWKSRDETVSGANPLIDITFVEATEPREEALAIAIALRETLEAKNTTAALVTPDRALARRVAAELTRWNIAVDDSAGVPLAETEAGRFARIVATVAAEELAPVPLLAFLRHPLSIFASEPQAIDALEQAILRGPRPAPGTANLVRTVEDMRKSDFHPHDPRARLQQDDWEKAAKIAGRIGASLAPLTALTKKSSPLTKLIEAHQKALASAGLDLGAPAREDMKALAEVFDKLRDAATDLFDLSLADYADMFAELIADPTVRPPFDPLARIRILGPLEARLQSVDRVIVGGLNEGTWPPEARVDAFINRPMRRELGLDLPERRIGLNAHDLAQVVGAREIVLTRARRQAGAETVASRFWQRIAAVAPNRAWNDALARGKTFIDLAQALDRPKEKPKPAAKPAPRPPRAARPKRLSVTEIGDLVRDPYTIYARHVLKLFPLEGIDADPGAAERGTVLHEALAAFTKAYPDKMPADGVGRLLALGRETFKAYADFPGTSAVWWVRFERVAHWFASEETERRKRIVKTHAEIRGKIEFPVEGEPFILTARADRIDLFADGSAGVVDYKTGAAPSSKEMRVGLAPQLPLEAAIARAGGFPDLPKIASVSEIAVMRLSGGSPAGKVQPFVPGNQIKSCDELADFNLARLKDLLTAFATEEQAYHPIPRPKWRLRYGKYDHLARIAEWSASGGEDE